MKEMKHAEALVKGIIESLQSDERSVIIARVFGSAFDAPFYREALKSFSSKVIDPPVSELGLAGVGVGAAMTGLRPLVSLSNSAFTFQAFPQIVSEAANIHYATRGRVSVPITFYMFGGIRPGTAYQHSAIPLSMFWNTPGLQIAVPSSPVDAKGLIKTAMLRSNSPTIFMDHELLQQMVGSVPEEGFEIPFGVAKVKREGNDVTIVATSIMVNRALEASNLLMQKYSISAEVVDPRTLVPLDRSTIMRSVEKTGRLVIADESQMSCGVSAEIAALVANEEFDHLKAPIKRVTIPDVPVSFSKVEEEAATPTSEKIVRAVREICK